MQDRKQTTSASGKHRVNVNVELGAAEVTPQPARKRRSVTWLAVSDEDPGGDPYNSTGQLYRQSKDLAE